MLDGDFAVSLKEDGASKDWSTIRWIQFSLQAAFVGSIVHIFVILYQEYDIKIEGFISL